MKELILTQGKVALVDDNDYPELNKHKWSAHFGRRWYAIRNQRINGKCNIIYLHRQIMQPTGSIIVDHKDGDGLNCQRYNMRVCSYSDNMRNSSCKLNNKGTSMNWCKTKFTSQIHIKGKKIHLGCFNSEVEAAEAYNVAALKYFGEFAKLNAIK